MNEVKKTLSENLIKLTGSWQGPSIDHCETLLLIEDRSLDLLKRPFVLKL